MTEQRAARPYRPSNGAEGEMFERRWCASCRRHKAFRDDPDNGMGCAIWGNALAYQIDEPGYPAELVQDARGPRCTAFEPLP